MDRWLGYWWWRRVFVDTPHPCVPPSLSLSYTPLSLVPLLSLLLSSPPSPQAVLLWRLRMYCTLLTLMLPYINPNFPLQCDVCDEVLLVSHITLSCGL